MTTNHLSVTVVDKPSLDIKSALTDDVLAEAKRYASRLLQRHLDASALAHGSGAGLYEPERAAAVLEQCIDAATDAIRTEFGGYSGLRWLWLLRRLPEVFFQGRYRTTQGADAMLAEVIAGQSSGRSRMVKEGDIRAYPLDGTVVRRLARYCASVRWLAERHRDYRCTGKGFDVEFSKGQLPTRHASEELRRSVKLYDRRAEQGGGLGGMGTEVFEPNTSRISLRRISNMFDGDALNMLVRVLPISPIDIQVPAAGIDLVALADEDVPVVSVRARYIVIPVSLESLSTLVVAAPSSGRPVVGASDAALLLLLFASAMHVAAHRAGFISLFTMGYLLSNEASFRALMADAAELAAQGPLKAILDRAGLVSAGQAIELLDQMRGRTWPLQAGPVLYRDDDALGVDLVAAGRRMSDIVFPLVQGALANARSEHFELRVQAAVDASRYAPPPEIAKLRGKKLKLNGRDITDLDAVARTGTKELLLISCKSVIYSPEYEKGSYRAVRNVASTARSARAEWEAAVAKLRANPVGETYDFTSWDLVGIVCTSNIVWVEIGQCTEDVLKGLRAVVSLSELQEWLGEPSPKSG